MALCPAERARREGLEPPTARSVGGCSASERSVLVGSALLAWEAPSVASGREGTARIARMIIGMIRDELTSTKY
jgi:hypothetical protein